MKKIIAGVVLCLRLTTLLAQVDTVGSGHAIQFDGIDDYIDLGNIYDDLAFPFTVSAWVNVSPSSISGPILVTQDNTPIYNGFWFIVAPGTLLIESGDGRGENSPVYRQGKALDLYNMSGRWNHYCAVVKGVGDIQLYINGYEAGGYLTGSSNLPMDSNYPKDVAKIGYFLSNGIIYRFTGMIDELRLFDKALSENEIQQQMCKKLSGTETNLIGYWNFDETAGDILYDKSHNHFNGHLKGNPKRVFSGAPIGDDSKFIYNANWTGVSLSMDNVTAKDIAGNPYGIHIYKVNNFPSQINGLTTNNIIKPYYGFFVASNDTGNTFSFSIGSDSHPCSVPRRPNNSIDTWQSSTNTAGIPDQIEIIPNSAETIPLELGANVTLCDQSNYAIYSDVTDTPGKSFIWNTGETTSSITVTHSGKYTLQVIDGCKSGKDSINIKFLQTPQKFSLGDDEIVCIPPVKTLSPGQNISGFEYVWQNGSTNYSLDVNDFGTYWVSVKNVCGQYSDSVSFFKPTLDKQAIPNVITPNGDDRNQYFRINQQFDFPVTLEVFNLWGTLVYKKNNYQNDWDGNGLATGVYFYRLSGVCIGEEKGSISIIR
ncbi:MAG TPA: LamG-like jellyroll fold domain-containing protein [Ohtaekwangia sp.]|uniref:LamG-like jellyroll fold domain-containing protein n=1 Tax=Ohtaekwangia sp. TaxID=2066019 RepID=UPI002F940D21